MSFRGSCMKRIFLLCMWLVFSMNMHSQIVYADYSDPDVCEGERGDYWLTASSFQCAPGLPILHSKDLAHWQLVNYAIQNVPYPDAFLSDMPSPLPPQHGKGVWAPSIRHHGDTYYIYWGDPDHGVWMVKTKDPAGEWEQPVLVVPAKGVIDTTPLWDDDGRCYLVNAWAASRSGFNSILTIRELSADGTRAIGRPVMVYDGQIEGNHTIEGPKLYKRGGYYYILAPAGGVEHGWQVALRSRNIYGPYESKVVYNNEGIHQGGMVACPTSTQRDDKQASFVCFQERGAYGRILHLLDVEWKDGWPMMKAHSTPKIASQDDSTHHLTTSNPFLRYQWHSNYTDTFGFPTSTGHMRVYSHNVSDAFRNLWEVPNLYLKKFEGETFCDTLHLTITAKTEGQQAGLVVMGRDYCRLAVELKGGEFVLNYITCRNADNNGEEFSTPITTVKPRHYKAGAKDNYECSISICIQCAKGGLCTFSYSLDGKKYAALQDKADGKRYTFQAREGKWIGAKYGVFSIAPAKSDRGWVEFPVR